MSLVARMVLYFVSLIVCFAFYNSANAAAYDQELEKLRHDWAVAKYQTPRNQQIPVFEKIIAEAENLNTKYPHQPAVMIWYGTVLSSYAQIKGGMSVLPHVKKARDLLEAAVQMNKGAEQGFGLGVLGALYARVPGWPVAFGDKAKARQYLQMAVQVDPKGSDANYYYGDFLVTVKEPQAAKEHLEIAKNAPIRPGHEIQDRGRKGEIASSLAKLKNLGH